MARGSKLEGAKKSKVTEKRIKKKVKKKKESGVGKLTTLVFGTLIAVVAFCGYNILPFFYCYFEIENQMQTVIQVAGTESDKEIRNRLMYHINKCEIPAEEEDLIIERETNKMKISLSYEEVFYITWKDKEYDIYTFPFDAYAEGSF